MKVNIEKTKAWVILSMLQSGNGTGSQLFCDWYTCCPTALAQLHHFQQAWSSLQRWISENDTLSGDMSYRSLGCMDLHLQLKTKAISLFLITTYYLQVALHCRFRCVRLGLSIRLSNNRRCHLLLNLLNDWTTTLCTCSLLHTSRNSVKQN